MLLNVKDDIAFFKDLKSRIEEIGKHSPLIRFIIEEVTLKDS